MATASDPPSRFAAAVLAEAPEWGGFPTAENQRRGYAGGQRRARDARGMELRGAGANDAGAQNCLLQNISEAVPGAKPAVSHS